jgi:hypothetical protein
MKSIIPLLLVTLLFASCYNTRLLVGNVAPTEPVVEVNKEWNHHFLIGLIPGNNAKMNPADYLPEGQKNYVVRTNQSFLNGLVSSVTFGIYTPTQTKYYIPFKDQQGSDVGVNE